MSNRTRIAIKLFEIQVVITALVSTTYYAMSGQQALLSALIGGLIGIVATGLFSIIVLFGAVQWSPQQFMQRFLRAEALKITIIVIAVLIAAQSTAVLMLPMSLTLVAVLLANWLLLLFNP